MKKENISKYSKNAQERIGEIMRKFKEGILRFGKNGKGGKVKSRKQAVAIGISEAKEAVLKASEQKDKKC